MRGGRGHEVAAAPLELGPERAERPDPLRLARVGRDVARLVEQHARRVVVAPAQRQLDPPQRVVDERHAPAPGGPVTAARPRPRPIPPPRTRARRAAASASAGRCRGRRRAPAPSSVISRASASRPATASESARFTWRAQEGEDVALLARAPSPRAAPLALLVAGHAEQHDALRVERAQLGPAVAGGAGDLDRLARRPRPSRCRRDSSISSLAVLASSVARVPLGALGQQRERSRSWRRPRRLRRQAELLAGESSSTVRRADAGRRSSSSAIAAPQVGLGAGRLVLAVGRPARPSAAARRGRAPSAPPASGTRSQSCERALEAARRPRRRRARSRRPAGADRRGAARPAGRRRRR